MENIARRRWITSVARLASRIVRRTVSAAIARFGGSAGQHPCAGVGVGKDSGQRLAHLVGNGGSHGVKGRHPSHVGQLTARLVQRFLSDFACRDVLNSAHENGSAFHVIDSLGDAVQMLQARFRSNRAEAEIGALALQSAPHLCIEYVQVVRVNPVAKRLHSRRRGMIDFEYAVELI